MEARNKLEVVSKAIILLAFGYAGFGIGLKLY